MSLELCPYTLAVRRQHPMYSLSGIRVGSIRWRPDLFGGAPSKCDPIDPELVRRDGMIGPPSTLWTYAIHPCFIISVRIIAGKEHLMEWKGMTEGIIHSLLMYPSCQRLVSASWVSG